MRAILFIFILFLLNIPLLKADPPDLMLLKTYTNQNISGWVMSEKLDGIRAYWDGSQLFTRHKQIINAPTYFLKDFPPFAIDGELFTQRNHFEEISSIVRSFEDKGWQKIKLYVFDIPNAEGDLTTRLSVLEKYLQKHPTPYIEIIKQIPIENKQQVETFLAQINQLHGEGIVVRDPQAPYENKRSAKILKLKTALDEECTVTAHHKGSGQFKDMLGSLSCKNQRGSFKIGSGFTIKDRKNPPEIGSIITYKYRGLTKNGLPKFATYWRVRERKIAP